MKTPGETLQYTIVHKHFKFCQHAANNLEEKIRTHTAIRMLGTRPCGGVGARRSEIFTGLVDGKTQLLIVLRLLRFFLGGLRPP